MDRTFAARARLDPLSPAGPVRILCRMSSRASFDETVRAARARFFARNGWAADGGYDDEWAEADFGVVRYRVPNTRARRAALRVHDVHHVLTGYDTDWRGEAEISAWELGSGVGRYPYAWLIALWGLFTGLVALRRETFLAFVRGRRSHNLLSRSFDEAWLDEPVASLRARLGVASRDVVATATDTLLFAAWSTLAVVLGALSTLPALGLVGLAFTRRALSWTFCGCSARAAASNA
jgi:hypothetical protein